MYGRFARRFAVVWFCALVAGSLHAKSSEGQNLYHGSGQCDLPNLPFCDAAMAVLPNWKGPVFKLSQSYPQSATGDPKPWLQFDPKTQPDQYMKAVLEYFYEGNIRADVERSFDPVLNTTRRWFNAPWQSVGVNGREFAHGLTRERTSRPKELAPTQTHTWNNYAVGFYNTPGGFVIGQVWANHGAPSPSAARFPDGTIAAKLLFTTATAQEVPYLSGSPEWSAYIASDPNNPTPPSNGPRTVQKVRLLQIDIAVRDSRVDATTGWVFGTFVYGGGPGGAVGNGWANVAPVGLMWGNDPGYSGSGPLSETWLNPKVQMPHVGYQGRLNGPVDNPSSSCISCHSTAESPAGQMIPPIGGDVARWFRNIPAGTAFDTGNISVDYSLQLAVGLSNFNAATTIAKTKSVTTKKMLIEQFKVDTVPPRDGGLHH